MRASRAQFVVHMFACMGLWAVSAPAQDDNELAQYYGFRSLEIFKLEERSGNLLAGDLNHDGRNDLILVDNSHSRLDLLQQRAAPPAGGDDADPRRVNLLPSHWRFEHRKIPVDHEVAAMALGDLNDDGRTDVAYFGLPDQLVVRFQPAEGDWTERTRIRLPDVLPVPWLLAVGDLNHDGRDDLVALGRYETYLIYQQDDGRLGTPQRLLNTSDKLGLAQIADVDGDGRNDLCYLTGDGARRSFCARLQGSDGLLGPEYVFELERPRAVSFHDLDGSPGQEVLAIEARSGRVKLLKFERPSPEPDSVSDRLIQYGFGRPGSTKDRDLAIGDLDGDGLNEVVVTDPDASRMIVFRQSAQSGLGLGSRFPGLVGAEHVRMFDFDGDGRCEVLVLSPSEKAIGLSRFEQGRLTFPQALPVAAEPVVFELADLTGDGSLEVLYVGRERVGRASKYTFHALQRSEAGEWRPFREPVAAELSSTPERLFRFNRGGTAGSAFLVFLGTGRTPQLFSSDLAEITAKGSFGLGTVGAGAVTEVQIDAQPALLVAQENFARSMRLDAEGRWEVLDQYNAAESNARIEGANVLDLDGQPGREIVLVDDGVDKLRILRREENVFRPWLEVDIGDFPFKSTRVADLNGDGRDDLLLFGADKFAMLYAGDASPDLVELASFESKLENVYPADVVGGDLNGDGRADLAVLDTRSHYLELLAYRQGDGLKHALYFRVFEEKRFSNANGTGAEPREAVIADVTGDGRLDLILLAHDRVLVYPQDEGREPTSAAAGP